MKMLPAIAALALAALAACAPTPERQAILNACASGSLDACALAENQRIAEMEAVYGDNVFVW